MKMKCLPVLLALVTAAQAMGSYVIMVPNAIRPGMNFRAMVHIFGGVKKTTVTINILRNGVIIGANSISVESSQQPRVIEFPLPPDLEAGGFSMQAIGKGGVNFNQTKSINFVSKDKSVFVQSDKAIYKPGDRVQFRTLSLFPDLKPYTEGVNISVYDSDSNKIYQWQEAKGYHGVVSKDFELSSQPVLGDWKIKVDAGKQSLEKTISIAEYVLPKFQVEAVMPSFALTKFEEISVKLKATYTYGKGVAGRVKVVAKLMYHRQEDDYENGQGTEFFNMTDTIDGELTIGITLPTHIHANLDGYKIAVKAEVLESVTGNVMTGYGYVGIFGKNGYLKFPPINANSFKPGLSYTAYLTASQPDGLPLAILDEEVEVVISVTSLVEPEPPEPVTEESVSGEPQPKILPETFAYPQEYTYVLKTMKISVPGSGLAFFDFVAPTDARSVRITASYSGQSVSHTCKQVHSPSDSFIQLSLAEYTTIKAGDDIGFKITSTMPLAVVVYQIISRGALASVGRLHGIYRKEFSFSVKATSRMAPSARIVAYMITDDGEMVVDSVGFDVSGAFQNYVDLSFSETEAEPGQEMRLHVTAEPLSQVFLLALDQSVLLLKSGNDITPSDVYDELEKYDTVSHSNDFFLPARGGAVLEDVAARSIWWPYPIFYGGTDADRILNSAGVTVITDVLVYRHKEDIMPYPVYLRAEDNVAEMQGGGGGGLKSLDRIRTKFPETWIWTDIRTCASGQATVVAKVPDTITSWIASVFAVHKGFGFGIAPSTARLQVFKSFFVSLNLPYSVIRGEYVAIQAIVFNYLDQDQLVKVTMPKSYSYYSIYIDCNGVEDRLHVDQVHSLLVKAGQSKSIYFPIVPIMLGHIDIEVRAQSYMAADGIRKSLLVEAEGVAMEFNQAVFIDLTREHNSFNKSLMIDLPFDVVEGSTLAKISVIGDIMGPSISGLDKLLRLPTGCGEQTLLSLAPDVYITEYLEKTSQLTGAISDKALSFMEKGYQQELTFKHLDGSFSAFGTRDPSGSMWLTAFVARVFHQASSHIVIDEDVIKEAITWIIGKQAKNGSFTEPGRVIHKNMQGRAGSGASLTAFVLICLCENKELYEDNSTAEEIAFSEAIAKALAYLEAEVAETDDLYLMALALYAFQLAESDQLNLLYNRISLRATREGGLTYWHLPAEEKEQKGSWRYPNQANAIDTEVTAYVLLTLTLQRDLNSGRSILRWVIQQRNPNGGFSSTQDTVVALQALSEIAELLYSDTFHITAKVSFDEHTTYTFNIDQHNALIKQRRQTITVPYLVEISATGEGIALVEIAVFFNIEKGVEDTSYTLRTTVEAGSINHFDLEVCTSRLGDDVVTGMVLAEIGILSGFDVDESKLEGSEVIKRVEKLDRKVVLYFDEITSNETCVTLHMDRVLLVAKSRPAVIRIYDYYEPSYQVTGFYSYEMVNRASICVVCSECENCTPPESVNDVSDEDTTTQEATTPVVTTPEAQTME